MNNHKKLLIIKIISLCLILLFFKNLNLVFANSFFEDENNLSFEHIVRESGLSNLSVSSIVQDKYGFIWFGTQSGLNCYDGRKMKVITNNPFDDNGLLHNLIQTMYYDEEKHELWIGTYQGLSRFYISENRFENYTVEDNGLSNPVVIALLKDDEGNIWIGTMDGLNKLDIKTGLLKKYEISKNVVRDLKIDSNGNFFIGTYNGLFYYDKELDEIKKFEIDLPSPYVMVIEEFEKGIITLGLWDGGVANLNLATKDIDIQTFSDNRIYSILETKDGNRCIGTWGGGLFVIKNNGEIYNFSGTDGEKALNHPIVCSLYQDNFDILWIGTNGGGISKINPRKHNYLKYYYDAENPDSLSQGKINSVFQDTRGNLWVAVYNNGLNLYNSVENKFIKYLNNPDDPDSLPDNQITDIIETYDGKLILGTFSGLYYYDMDLNKFDKIDVLPEDTLVYAVEEINDSEIFIGTYKKGAFRYNKKTSEVKQFSYIDKANHSLSDNLVYDILCDSKKRIWIATNNGLNLLKDGEDRFKIYNRVSGDYNQLGSNTIKVMYEDSKGRIWVGMIGGGIALYNEELDSFTSFTEKIGMSSNIVVGIEEDSKGRIWAATHNGISIIEPETGNIFVLTAEDGIGGLEFNSGHLVDDDGNILFGGIHGITKIPGEFLESSSEPPKLYITDIEVYQNSIDENKLFFNDEKLSFKYDDGFLGFKVTALDFDLSKKLTFSYKLEGFDNEWIYAGNRDYFSYSNLEPGAYTLKVMASTVRNVPSEIESVSFTIETPWFRTRIAYFIYVIIGLILILLSFKIRAAQLINKRNSELGQINRKLEIANIELEKLSIKDSLTGIFNRRYFDIIIDEQLNLAKRSGSYLSLLMMDIDNFKDINDNFGHIAGDCLLTDISNLIALALPRNTDFVARYGGDEFVIVMYDTGEEGSLLVAKRIKEVVEDVIVRPEFGESNNRITVSIGLVSIIPTRDITVKEIIQAADNRLYFAKKNGKNQICVASIN